VLAARSRLPRGCRARVGDRGLAVPQAPGAARRRAVAAQEGRSQLLEADAKTRLQEIAQARGGALPEYRLTGATGPDHSRLYRVECWLDGQLVGEGEGSSKKQAEQRAAAGALIHLQEKLKT
jgi:dsRNA-specific ribonuclease